MKFSTLALLLGAIISTAAHAENIIRISAPITAAKVNIDDFWVEADMATTEWKFYMYDSCSVKPVNKDLGVGSFTQEKGCYEFQTRTVQQQQYNTYSKEYRPIGDPSTQYRTSSYVKNTYRSGECRYDRNKNGATSLYEWQAAASNNAYNGLSWNNNSFGGGGAVWNRDTGVSEFTWNGTTYFAGKFGETSSDGVWNYYVVCKTN